MTTHKNKTIKIISVTLDLYLNRPLTQFGDAIIYVSSLLTAPIWRPVAAELKQIEQHETLVGWGKRTLRTFDEMEAEKEQREVSEVKSKAGYASVEARRVKKLIQSAA